MKNGKPQPAFVPHLVQPKNYVDYIDSDAIVTRRKPSPYMALAEKFSAGLEMISDLDSEEYETAFRALVRRTCLAMVSQAMNANPEEGERLHDAMQASGLLG